MLLAQTTKCDPENPLTMELINISEHPWHMHDKLEVIYVLKGTLKCGISIYPSEMKSGDIAVINTETLHHFTGDNNNIVLMCHIDLEHFSNIIPEIENTLIICNSGAAVEYDKHYDIIKELVAKLFLFYYELKPQKQDELMDSCVDFLSALYNHFNFLQHDGTAIHSENTMKQRPLQAERVKRVMKYMYDNMGSHVSLEDIAAKEYVSKYYLSHLVSEFLKMPFREYLSMTRSVYAQDHLYGTDKPLSEIADICGFSSTESFRKAYIKYAGMTPSEARKRIVGHTIKDIPLSHEDVLSYMAVEDISALMGVKPYHDTNTIAFRNASYPVTNIHVNFAELHGQVAENMWDTVWLNDPQQILSFRMLGALAELHRCRLFNHVFVESKSLEHLYSVFKNWDFAGSFLSCLKENNFTLLIDRHTEIIDSFIEFSCHINGPEIHIRQRPECPALYKTTDTSYLFDESNHKTKAFYIYYFLNNLLPYRLYADDSCCVTHSDNRLSIMLYSKPDAGIRKYMFNLKHLTRNYICRTFKINEHYESETDIYRALAISDTTDKELAEIISRKAHPEVELSIINGLPEYNLFLSLPPDTVMLIELT